MTMALALKRTISLRTFCGGRRIVTVVAGVLLVFFCSPTLAGADAWVEDFDNIDGWASVWRYTPAEFRAEDGALLLVSPPEGSTAVATTTPQIDLERYRYLVIRVTDVGGEGDGAHQFRISLNLMAGGRRVDRSDGTCSVFAPGFADPTLIVVDMHDPRIRWREQAAVAIEVQACYARTRIGVESLKFTDSLSPREKADWQATRARILGPEPAPFHGLDEMATRRGWVHGPYFRADAPAGPASPNARPRPTRPHFEAGQRYLSERLIYRDSVTGTPVWRLTNYPCIDGKYYMNRLHWNADGSVLRFSSVRTGRGEQWFMDADGTDLRTWTMGIPGCDEAINARSFCWDEKHADRFYVMKADGARRTVLRVNRQTGEQTEAVSIEMAKGSREFKVHPDGKHFLFCEPQGSNTSDDAVTRMYVAGPEGLMHTFTLKHNVQDKTNFTGRPDLSLYVVCTRPREKRGGWLMGPDGSNRIRFLPRAGHDDWTGSGSWLVGYHENQIFALRHDGAERRTLVHVRTGGHLGCALDDRSVLSDVGHNGPWSNALLFMDILTCSAHRVCMASSSFTGHGRQHIYHPNIHSNHPHPSLSPDGTKGLFQSDYMSTYSNVYMVVTHLPDPPQGTRIDGRRLCWRPGQRHRETKGYFVYRADQSGGPYRRVTADPVADTQWAVEGGDGFYVVTAVEHSGLESLPSSEVCTAREWPGRVRWLIEAEQCELGPNTRPRLGDGSAVGMYAVGLRDDATEGSLMMETSVPRAGAYRLLARIRGEGSIGAGDGAAASATGRDAGTWRWREIGRLRLEPGERKVEVHLKGAVHVDQLLLTDEARHVPDAGVVLDAQAPEAPVGLRATVLDPFTIRLNWRPSQSADVSHYNVYCGSGPAYAPSQARRIGSPAEPVFVDWGLRPATACYYKVVAVDRAGNESVPAQLLATTGDTPIVTQIVEGESGDVSDGVDVIDHRAAENGRAVRFPLAGEPGALTVAFDVPRDGEYAIWAHVYQDHGDADPLAVHLDEDVQMPWRVRVAGRQWGWDFVGGEGRLGKERWGRNDGHVVANPMLLRLRKGHHTLKLVGAQGHCLDRLVVTNNPHWEKTGFDALRGGH